MLKRRESFGASFSKNAFFKSLVASNKNNMRFSTSECCIQNVLVKMVGNARMDRDENTWVFTTLGLMNSKSISQ